MSTYGLFFNKPQRSDQPHRVSEHHDRMDKDALPRKRPNDMQKYFRTMDEK